MDPHAAVETPPGGVIVAHQATTSDDLPLFDLPRNVVVHVEKSEEDAGHAI